ncbi:RING finger domain-containing protein [Cardinium endosymbiont of Culicoides punctatus]|uniref:RING finger domain-containing protein n=1 Tax=Cardinium endosymbiont of Culicoides punctatus TaxID=2304601 RepID=UPI001058A8F9|nr:RING finger domain-containing protein [Cardinium endosymbiont of Culicoides punctatus]TDG93269.1 hypothetical protein CCPUN_09250 [Cardinium endosymbiont of Culicoides punctatus]
MFLTKSAKVLIALKSGYNKIVEILINIDKGSKLEYSLKTGKIKLFKTLFNQREKKTVYDVEKEEMSETCTICLDKLNNSSESETGSDKDIHAIKLKCGHLFHLDCLFSWINVRKPDTTCPYCRKAIN